jgi:hypothetical protein
MAFQDRQLTNGMAAFPVANRVYFDVSGSVARYTCLFLLMKPAIGFVSHVGDGIPICCAISQLVSAAVAAR